ncbi:TIGR01777 family oxidoreductase [Nonlabens antarcticus]|uniref:TIGR01777 family oxidoreductase n=1 Tax=Nonlabens antarcticus TaxID=392714 RepID=UPI001891A447|nr:TIGR01777 family oxidoreductase [Nonlabens antarcticus]
MKILITGATGLIGSKVSEVLRAAGHSINYLTSREEAIKNESNNKGFLWDVKAMTIDPNCISGVDTIIHLAGESVFQKWTEEAKDKIMSSRINSTQLLLNLLEESENQVQHAITASAIGIYPDKWDGQPMKENEVPPTADNFLGEVCVEWEKVGKKFKDLGLKHSIVRIGIVLAAKGGALEQMAKPVKLYAGAGFASGKMWQSWVAIDDLAGIFKHITENELVGVYNGVAPNPIQNRPMMEAIGDVLGKPVFLPNVPAFMMKLILGEMAATILASQYASSTKIEESGYLFKLPQLKPALEKYLD